MHTKRTPFVSFCLTMLSTMSGAVALYSVGLVSMASRRPHVSKPKQSRSQSQSNVGGFGFDLGGQKKEELWRCVEGCGACCKLNKGPSFATPEEIFHDPSDIQVTFFFRSFSFLNHYFCFGILDTFLRFFFFFPSFSVL